MYSQEAESEGKKSNWLYKSFVRSTQATALLNKRNNKKETTDLAQNALMTFSCLRIGKERWIQPGRWTEDGPNLEEDLSHFACYS
jgi:hypothetical protein